MRLAFLIALLVWLQYRGRGDTMAVVIATLCIILDIWLWQATSKMASKVTLWCSSLRKFFFECDLDLVTHFT